MFADAYAEFKSTIDTDIVSAIATAEHVNKGTIVRFHVSKLARMVSEVEPSGGAASRKLHPLPHPNPSTYRQNHPVNPPPHHPGLYSALMEISFNPAHYAHVPVYFWPWIWWQLFWLRGWAEATRRDVLFEIAANGRVHVVLISDDKADLRAWMQAQKRVYRDHWTPMHDASGEAHLGSFHYWMGRFMACGQRVNFISRRIGFDPAPAIEDSS